MLQVESDSRVASGTVLFVRRRKWETRVTPNGIMLYLEPEQEWLKSSAVIHNVRVPVINKGSTDAPS